MVSYNFGLTTGFCVLIGAFTANALSPSYKEIEEAKLNSHMLEFSRQMSELANNREISDEERVARMNQRVLEEARYRKEQGLETPQP